MSARSIFIWRTESCFIPYVVLPIKFNVTCISNNFFVCFCLLLYLLRVHILFILRLASDFLTDNAGKFEEKKQKSGASDGATTIFYTQTNCSISNNLWQQTMMIVFERITGASPSELRRKIVRVCSNINKREWNAIWIGMTIRQEQNCSPHFVINQICMNAIEAHLSFKQTNTHAHLYTHTDAMQSRLHEKLNHKILYNTKWPQCTAFESHKMVVHEFIMCSY